MTIASLSPLFQGDFAVYGDLFRLPNPVTESDSAEALLDSDYMDRILAAFQPDCPSKKRRFALSLWSQHYFVKLIGPVLAANLILKRELEVGLTQVRIILDEEALPDAFEIRSEGNELTEFGLTRFEHLFTNHLYPLVDGWAEQWKLSPRVFWGNVARDIYWTVSLLRQQGFPETVWQPGITLLRTASLAGRENPLLQCYQWTMDDSLDMEIPLRRNCCLRYQLPHIELCEDCPRHWADSGEKN